MTCIVGHNGEAQPRTTTLTFHRDGQTVVANEVPAEVCENCGEAYVAEDVTAKVLEIVSPTTTGRTPRDGGRHEQVTGRASRRAGEVGR
jgi:YgiT-type zinc finger domain-containing protein